MSFTYVFITLCLYLHTVEVHTTCTDNSPTTTGFCSNCERRCGHASTKALGNLSGMCSCDAKCIAYGDCCYDFKQTCIDQYNAGTKMFRRVVGGGSSCREWRLGNENVTVFEKSLIVDRCSNGTACTLSNNISDPAQSVPITDPRTGVHYLNYKCARCNFVSSFQLWGVWLDCKGDVRNRTNGTGSVATGLTVQSLLDSRACQLKFSIPTLNPGQTSDYRRNCELAVSSCSQDCSVETLIGNCTNSIYQSYVFGQAPGIVYKNPYCAYCQDTKGREPQLYCRSQTTTTTTPTTTTTTTTTTTRPPATKATNVPAGKPAPGLVPLEPPPGVAGREGPIFDRAGLPAARAMRTSPPVFVYEYDVEAGSDGMYEFEDGSTKKPPSTTSANGQGFQAFSLRVLLDFNPPPVASPTLLKVPGNPCGPGEIWIPREEICRSVLCPEGFTRIEALCFLSTINMNFTTTLTFTQGSDANASLQYIDNNEKEMLKDFIHNVRDAFYNFTDIQNQTMNDVDRINVTLSNSSKIDMTLDEIDLYLLNISIFVEIEFHLRDKPHNISGFFSSQQTAFTDNMNEIIIEYLESSGIDLSTVNIITNGSLVFSGLDVNPNRCKIVSYNETEYNKDMNGTITILATKRTYNIGMYTTFGKTVRICLSFRRSQVEWIAIPSSASGTLGLVTLVLISLSIICLIIRLLLQACIPYYRSFAGWLQFHLCLSLCLAFVSLLVSGTASILADSYIFCLLAAVLMYWMFLAAFLWMFCIALNTWLAFRPSSAFKRASDQDKHAVKKYVLCAWFLPLVLVAIATGLDFLDIDDHYKPSFGVGICWFNQPYALLLFFGVPIGCCMLLSLIFYSLTVHSLRKTEVTTKKLKSSHNPSKIRIYVSLFSVMGICWVFGFLAAFIQLQPPFESVLWYIFIVLNASQGMFIFVFFVCKKNIFKELKKKFIHTAKKRTVDSSVVSRSSRTESENTGSTAM